MQPEPDRFLSIPEHRRLLEHFVRKRPDLAQDAAMDLEDRVPHVRDTAFKRLRRAVREMVLTEDALGLRLRRPLPGAERLEAYREIAELVLRQEQGEAKALLVVLAPHPRPAHVRIGKTDRRANELLDCLSDGRHAL